MPIFRSQRQAELLAHLFLHVHEASLTEIAARLEVSPGALHSDVERLVEAGLIHDRRVGRTRLLRANTTARGAKALAQLLLVTYGPEQVVREQFAAIPDVTEVYIYGSWARRYHGEVGPEPADIDVMVIGTADRDGVYEAADRAAAQLGIPVNAVVRTERAWTHESDALVATAKLDAIPIIHEGEQA